MCDELTKIVPERIQQIEELIAQKEGALIELGDFNKPFVTLITQASQLKNLGSLNVASDSCPLKICVYLDMVRFISLCRIID